MKLAPGLHRLGNDLVAAYLVIDATGITLVDAGLPGHRRHLLAELHALDATPRDIRGLVLTHGDPDHIGFAAWLHATHGVPVFLHPADAERAAGHGGSNGTGAGGWRLLPALRFAWTAIRERGWQRSPVTDATPIADGDVLSLPGSPRIIGMPGHSAGSVAVLFEGVRAVMAGDALTTRHVLTGEARPQSAPFTDDPARARAALTRIAELDVDWVLPGHGTPWRGAASTLVEAIERHPDARRPPRR